MPDSSAGEVAGLGEVWSRPRSKSVPRSSRSPHQNPLPQ